MPDITFEQSIALAIIDKLALGGVVGFAGFLANRVLERFRTGEAIRSKVAEVRVQKISEIWEQVENIHLGALRVYMAGRDIFAEESKGWSAEESRVFATEQQLPKSTVARLKSDLESAVNELSAQTRKARDLVFVKQFWLGEAMQTACTHHIQSLDNLLEGLRQNLFSGKMMPPDDYVDLALKARFSREDITDIVRRL